MSAHRLPPALREAVRELTSRTAVVVEAGWAVILAGSWVVLRATGWLDHGRFPIDTVVSVMACWMVAVLLALALDAAADEDPPQPPDHYRPLYTPRWWLPPAVGLVGLALGFAFWR